jgi:hypothetical protein
MDAEEMLRMEYAENIQRKDFTITERLEYADKIKAVEKAKALQRKALYARDGHQENAKQEMGSNCLDYIQDRDVRPYPEKERVREAIARKVGFTSGRQYERVAKVAEERPDLLEKIKTGESTIYGAYQQMMGGKKGIKTPPAIPLDDNPVLEKREKPDQIARAGHDRLMRNPLYAKLYTEKREAIEDANRAWADHDRKAAFFENQVKHFTNNIDALRQRCEKYLDRIKELEAQLGIDHSQEEYA